MRLSDLQNKDIVNIEDGKKVGKIIDVPIYFTHYKTREEAVEKWYERAKRFDENNVYIITDDNGLSHEGKQRLINSRHKRLIIFTDKDREDEYSFKLANGFKKPYSVRDVYGFAPFEREFNYANWLSDKNDYKVVRKQW